MQRNTPTAPISKILDVFRTTTTHSKRLPLSCLLLILFSVTALAQTYQGLYEFNCAGGVGCSPYNYGRLTQGTDGYLYGTAYSGGAFNHGTIFKIDTTGTSVVDLYDLNGTSDGYSPTGGLTLASVDGNFYGITIGGGTSNNGTLFRFNPSTSTFTVLHNFTTTEGSPLVAPIEAKDKNLYGTNQTAAPYRLVVGTGTYQLLPNKVPGVSNAPLFQASDGYLYGTSQVGGTKNLGTVFRMTTAGVIKVVHNFSGTDGQLPQAAVVQGSNGNLYGTTSSGGAFGDGTVFELALPAFTFTKLHDFAGSDGNNPTAGLLPATDGNLYGTTEYGGVDVEGTLFQMTQGGLLTSWFDFTGVGGTTSGGYPIAGLVEHTNGTLYGVTLAGGANNDGVFYGLTLPNINPNITLCCNWWVILDQPVTILGQNLTGVFSISIGGASARFVPGSDTYLTAYVPNGAVDGVVTVTLATGQQLQSQQNVHVLPKITSLDPLSGSVGTLVNVTGGGLSAARKVTFGGVPATTFNVLSPSLIQATVPSGAITGRVGVVTPNGSAVSKQTFTVN